MRIDPQAVDPSLLVADLQRLEPAARSDLRVSSQIGLQVIAAAAREGASGQTVGLNIVLTPDGFVDRTTTENGSRPPCPAPPTPGVPPWPDGCVWPLIAGTEAFNSDAYTWSYMRAGGIQNIGVGEAWRALALAGLLGNAVTIAVIDGGFSDLATDNPHGGQDQLGSIGRTLYEWDGTAWTPRATLPDPAHGFPPAVLPSPFAFDRQRNVYVLYRVFDTWELDGAGQWARRAARIDAM